MREINQIIIHCSATKKSQNIGANDIREWHKNQGWSDIGYNYVIKRDGTIENGRDLDGDGNVDEEVGAHAKGFNSNSIGICLVGGMSDSGGVESNFTLAQYMALLNLVTNKIDQYPEIKEVLGHCDLPNTNKTCPNFDVKSFFDGML